MPRVVIQTSFDEVQFSCQRCGSCCRHRRPIEFDDLVPLERLPEFVEKSNLIYLTDEDIRRISKKSGRKPEDFVDTIYEYDGSIVKVEGDKVILDLPVMKSRPDTTCVFYDDGCTVYAARPRACRLFPFRVEEESTPEGDVILRIGYNQTCPGIGKGPRVDRKGLEKLVADQFIQRMGAVSSEIGKLSAQGKIRSGARVFRTHPGRR